MLRFLLCCFLAVSITIPLVSSKERSSVTQFVEIFFRHVEKNQDEAGKIGIKPDSKVFFLRARDLIEICHKKFEEKIWNDELYPDVMLAYAASESTTPPHSSEMEHHQSPKIPQIRLLAWDIFIHVNSEMCGVFSYLITKHGEKKQKNEDHKIILDMILYEKNPIDFYASFVGFPLEQIIKDEYHFYMVLVGYLEHKRNMLQGVTIVKSISGLKT